MEKVRQRSVFDWRIIQIIRYEDYIWWSYPNVKLSPKFESFNYQLDLKNDNGTPKCIMKIIQIINRVSYFNKEIRKFIWVITWHQQILKYYNRYYRYLKNERLFGKKNFLNYKHGHKLHFISCLKNRELTGFRLNKNHLVF